MYTTNAIEAINSSFRKVTKKGAFPNETALLKLLYLRVMELEKKWQNGHIANWSLVLNQLMVNEQFHDRISKYLNKWEENRNRAIAKAISALAIKSGDDKSVDNKIDLHLWKN